jgi:hypothetical protein
MTVEITFFFMLIELFYLMNYVEFRTNVSQLQHTRYLFDGLLKLMVVLCLYDFSHVVIKAKSVNAQEAVRF